MAITRPHLLLSTSTSCHFIHHVRLIQMVYKEVTWYKTAAENKCYTAFIPPQSNMRGSSLRVKWFPLYIRTYLIAQESLLISCHLMYNKLIWLGTPVAITHFLSHVVKTFILKRICIFGFTIKTFFWNLWVKGLSICSINWIAMHVQ